MIVGLNSGSWSDTQITEIKGCVPAVRLEYDRTSAITRHIAQGIDVCVDFWGPYDKTNGVSGINVSTFTSKVLTTLALFDINHVKWISVLNEPEGSWFWEEDSGDPPAYRTLVKAVSTAVRAKYGTQAPRVIGSWWGGQWWQLDSASYCDYVEVHPYGGNSNKAQSALGNRQLVTTAHVGSGVPVWCGEIGWPTAVGQPVTGDSMQWSEQEQAQNITGFVTWARGTGYVAGVMVFQYRDFGSNNWYGVTRSDGSRKPGYDALKAVAIEPAPQPEETSASFTIPGESVPVPPVTVTPPPVSTTPPAVNSASHVVRGVRQADGTVHVFVDDAEVFVL